MDSDFTPPPYTSSSPDGAAYSTPVSYGQDPHKVEPQSTVVVIQEDAPIRDDLLWSIFNTIYFNACCLGFTALTYSVKSRDRKLFGDKIGATSYATTARKFNIAATVISIIVFILIIIINVTAR